MTLPAALPYTHSSTTARFLDKCWANQRGIETQCMNSPVSDLGLCENCLERKRGEE